MLSGIYMWTHTSKHTFSPQCSCHWALAKLFKPELLPSSTSAQNQAPEEAAEFPEALNSPADSTDFPNVT